MVSFLVQRYVGYRDAKYNLTGVKIKVKCDYKNTAESMPLPPIYSYVEGIPPRVIFPVNTLAFYIYTVHVTHPSYHVICPKGD